MAETWLKCTECRTDIPFGGRYYVCSVSTCNKGKIRFQFCSVICWDSHLSSVRHRDAGAIEATAPSKEQWAREAAAEATPDSPARFATPDSPARFPSSSSSPTASSAPSSAPGGGSGPAVRRVVADAGSGSSMATTSATPGTVTLSSEVDRDILIVVSKLKKYIKDRSGFNCSDSVADHLSEHVRAIADEAIRTAARDERKTVLDRDVPRARRS